MACRVKVRPRVVQISLLIAVIPCAVAAQPSLNKKEAELRSAFQKVVQSVNSGDFPSAETVAPNANYMDSEGRIAEGPESIRIVVERERGAHRRQLEATIDGVRFISNCVAAVESSWSFARDSAGGAETQSARHGHATVFWLRSGGRWRLIAIRSHAAPLPPATIQPPPPAVSKSEDFPSPMWSLILGALISLYLGIVVARLQRYRDLVRELARRRTHNDGYPVGPADLPRAVPPARDFFFFVERTEWALNAEGHTEVAKKVDLLRSFSFEAGVQMEKMLGDKNKGQSIDNYFSWFTEKYAEGNKQFSAFERTFWPNFWSLLQLWPHETSPSKGGTTVVRDPWFQ